MRTEEDPGPPPCVWCHEPAAEQRLAAIVPGRPNGRRSYAWFCEQCLRAVDQVRDESRQG